ncbi:MAG TPA: histidine phosphatase family protein [Caulobacteraceae bacterium]|jgi:broad specificity phosphatase PhoE|nr:histidine phosphatase family protein [Caulobacteraceae bacterium]
MLLHCLRHGASVANLAHRFNPEDDPLHEATVVALRAAQRLNLAYDRIYVSPLPRAVQTAEHLGLARWTLDPRITERRLGVFAGLTAAECEARHAQAFEDFGRLEAEPAIPEGESRGQHLARVAAWLEDASSAGDARVLAVTHGGVIDFVYRMATGHPLHGGEDIFGGENLGLSAFEVDWPDVRLLSFSAELPGLRADR